MPFGDLRRHIVTYGKLSGRVVDPAELDYCVVLVLTRWCIAMSMGLAKTSVALEVAILVKFLQVNLFALVKIMARLSGARLPPMPEGVVTPGATTSLYDFTAAVLDTDQACGHRAVSRVARSTASTGCSTYLRNLSDYGSDRLRVEELGALRSVLGDQVGSVEEGRVALPSSLAQGDRWAARGHPAMAARAVGAAARSHATDARADVRPRARLPPGSTHMSTTLHPDDSLFHPAGNDPWAYESYWFSFFVPTAS